MRLAMVYSMLNKTQEATDWLMKATASGYNGINDLDSLPAFSNLRSASNFQEIRKEVYEIVYPCSKEPRNHDFDFWIGDWNVYRTGTRFYPVIVMSSPWPADVRYWKIIRPSRLIPVRVLIFMTR